jgi:hypothetical protein
VDLLERLQSLMAGGRIKSAVTQRFERLVDTVAALKQQVAERDDVPATRARSHVETLETLYHQALDELTAEQHLSAELLLNEAEIHGELARLQLQMTLDRKVTVPGGDTPAHAMLTQLSDALVQTKTAIEYSNYKVTTSEHKALNTVASHLDKALELYKGRLDAKAKAMAEAGLLLLCTVVADMHFASKTRIPLLKLNHKQFDSSYWRVKELVDQVCDCRLKAPDGTGIPAEVTEHLNAAGVRILTAIDRLLQGDNRGAESAVAAGLLDVRYADKLCVETSSSTQGLAQREGEAHFEFGNNLRRFERIRSRLQQLLDQKDGRQWLRQLLDLKDEPQRPQTVLENVAYYFETADLEASKGNLVDAKTMAQAAYYYLTGERASRQS